MFLTKEILEKYGACDRGKYWFKTNCGDGMEIKDILAKTNVPKDMIYWAKQWLNLSDEEINLYNWHLDIVDSYNIFNSYEVKNSNNIMYSHSIEDSSMVKHSDNIYNGIRIYNSTDIKNCVNITQGIEQRNTQVSLASTNITDSFEVLYSSDVDHSRHIERCDQISNSTVLRLCREVENSAFSANLFKCSNCLFCNNLTDKHNYIFNTEMPEETVAIIRKVLNDKLNYEGFRLVTSVDTDGNFDLNMDAYDLSDDFYKWVYNLIKAKEDKSFILAQITLLKNWKRKFDFK